jgi:LacI family transcriptional regulator
MNKLEQSDFSLKDHKRREKHVIGLTFSDAQSLFTFTLMSAIEKQLAETSYQLLLFNMEKRQNVHHYFSNHLDFLNKVDGLIISAAELNEEGSAFFKSLDIPVVLMQARCAGEMSISTNNFIGCQDAASYLLSRGYERIAFVGWTPEDEHINDRFMGFTSTLMKSGKPLDESYYHVAPLSSEGGYRATERLLNLPQPPEVIFYGCDDMAAGGYRYLRAQNLRVPQDIGIMGFDDLSIAETLGITTMKQFVEKKSEMAVDYLLDRLSGKVTTSQNNEISINPKLVVRSSTR